MRTRTWLAALPLLAMLAAGAQPVQFDMVRVPGGCYRMGTESGEKHERPVHEVCLQAFEIGRTEVTQGQWLAVMGANPARFPLGETAPVEMVSWNDAQEFVRRLNAAGGRYRLPSEAEWEYACRSGGKDETFAGTDKTEELLHVAWYNKMDAGNMTHPVATKRANGLGLHDMSGNVWEWTASRFDSPYGNPQPEGKYVIRGGSWDGKANYVRCAIRNRYEPDRRDPRIGLRLARDAAP
ncbi:formylglycine-generating enzyme family protein [Ramlibacter sp. XY19]|uniref:formylglycine-generating enzyme family protein n=1 Tax=Ramlibacter paludis TaxID=2908000 RepID=UPI0023DAB601|nr:formylglycine-generating enzyme family protein [Ramlibacter paludis]MCG2592564.1 formylglycine-generating enzyme family protein [Ramlibacter paludis]